MRVAKKRKRADHPRAPRRPTIQRREISRAEPDDELDTLSQLLKRALYADHPLALLELVSGLMASTLPRPGAAHQEPKPLDDLVGSFAAVDLATTTAALHVLAEFVPDELLTARIRRVLQTREQPMPAWLRELAATRVVEVYESYEELDDGRNTIIDVRLDDGSALTAVIYIDHNIGTIVKDAFLLDRPSGEVRERFLELEPDVTISAIDPALARAKIERAIQLGAITLPHVESESWPGTRPLVEWLLRLLPDAVELPDWEPMPDHEQAAILDSFLRSPHGAPYADSEAHLRLLDDLMWFGTGYGTCDPLRWTPVNVEVLLVDWFPRKVVADVEVLTLLPDLLRALVRYAHEARAILPGDRAATLASIGRWESEYQRLIRTDRPQGPAALARALLENDFDLDALIERDLLDQVGGEEALDRLDDRPLPDEPFDPAGIPADIRPKILEMVALCDASADELFDDEHRTANRRLVRLLATSAPEYFRGRAAADTSAAAVAWMVARANDSLSSYGPVTAADLLATFGVESVSQRVRKFRDLMGLSTPPPALGHIPLGRPELLVAEVRAGIIGDRDVRRLQ
ncbi:MAG: hypothetical protein JWM84_1411 [Nocardioides sp.]|nr:hypothetical protein [Nocardioides sp.]